MTEHTAEIVHTSALNIGVNRVVCTCGEDFREHAYHGDAVAQFARHLRELSTRPGQTDGDPS